MANTNNDELPQILIDLVVKPSVERLEEARGTMERSLLELHQFGSNKTFLVPGRWHHSDARMRRIRPRVGLNLEEFLEED